MKLNCKLHYLIPWTNLSSEQFSTISILYIFSLKIFTCLYFKQLFSICAIQRIKIERPSFHTLSCASVSDRRTTFTKKVLKFWWNRVLHCLHFYTYLNPPLNMPITCPCELPTFNVALKKLIYSNRARSPTKHQT